MFQMDLCTSAQSEEAGNVKYVGKFKRQFVLI